MDRAGGAGPGTPRLRHRRRSTENLPDAAKENGGSLLVNDQNKYKSMLIRAYSSFWMIGGFAFIVYMGHLYITAMVVVIQIFMAMELFSLLRKSHEDRQLPGFRLLNWHFFFTAMLFVYGRILSQRLVNTVTVDHVLYKLVSSLMKYNMAICYFLYITGFVWFILSLKKKMYKYQFGQYAWTHMILIVVFTQSSFTVANIFEGIFWFLLPATLIVINDIFAYIFGFFFGKTPLIKLSPKKTWEGFIGASFTTIIAAFVLANVLGRYQWLTCPRKDLTTGWLHCDPGPLYKPEYHELPGWISKWLPWKEIAILPVQWHALCLGLFASIIAPFGGFFASGFKRAFKIKGYNLYSLIGRRTLVIVSLAMAELLIEWIARWSWLCLHTSGTNHLLFLKVFRWRRYWIRYSRILRSRSSMIYTQSLERSCGKGLWGILEVVRSHLSILSATRFLRVIDECGKGQPIDSFDIFCTCKCINSAAPPHFPFAGAGGNGIEG